MKIHESDGVIQVEVELQQMYDDFGGDVRFDDFTQFVVELAKQAGQSNGVFEILPGGSIRANFQFDEQGRCIISIF